MAEFVRRGTEWKTNGVLKQTRQGIFDDRGYKITNSIAKLVYFVPLIVLKNCYKISFYDFTKDGSVPFLLTFYFPSFLCSFTHYIKTKKSF